MTEAPRLAPGDPAPDFELTTDTGETLRLADLAAVTGSGRLEQDERGDEQRCHGTAPGWEKGAGSID